MNQENYDLVLKTIKDNPACWKQDSWHCGSSHCFAGWAQVIAGRPISDTVRADAREFLDISRAEANYLFSPDRTIEDFDGFNRAGYDCDGFNRAGYDCAGFNRAGCDRDGFNRSGYDRAGFNRAGYDRAGYDRAGFNRAGYDCDGFDLQNKRRK